MFPKNKPVRLKGQALKALCTRVFERDGGRCILCGEFVDEGVKPHHEPCGSGRKSDELNKMVVLCNNCHYQRHFGDVISCKTQIEAYQERLKNEK